MQEPRIYIALERADKRLLIDGDSSLLGELLEILKVRAPKRERRQPSQPEVKGQQLHEVRNA